MARAGFENFSSYKKGRRGEVAVLAELKLQGKEVKDYTNDYATNKVVQRKGFDMEIFNGETQLWDRADVKNHVSRGQVALEIKKSNGKPGWFETSRADYIIVYDEDNHAGYKYTIRDMKEYLARTEVADYTTRDGAVLKYVSIEGNNFISRLF
jgi:hypothetical protein